MSIHQYQQHSPRSDAGRDVPVNAIAERAKFIERTYLHLAGAIAVFIGVEYLFLSSAAMKGIAIQMLQTSWLLVLGLFIGVSWIADYFARQATSRPLQYVGLALYVVAEAFIFMPLLMLAQVYGGPDTIMTAGISTLAIFAALTGIVLVTKKDFSWMRSGLMVAGVGVLLLIVLSSIFGFTLGIGFVVGMIVLSACYILYYTTNIMKYYHPEAYVSAALALFSAVALMFWYILQFVMSLTSRE